MSLLLASIIGVDILVDIVSVVAYKLGEKLKKVDPVDYDTTKNEFTTNDN